MRNLNQGSLPGSTEELEDVLGVDRTPPDSPDRFNGGYVKPTGFGKGNPISIRPSAPAPMTPQKKD